MKKINEDLLLKISEKAKKSVRRRMNYNFHPEDADILQRMLNALEPDTYIQPHKHQNPDKVEVFMVLRGRILVVEFNDEGDITDHLLLDATMGNYAAEIAPRTWHTIVCLEKGTVAYEVKNGPYNPTDDKMFASWAPPEGDPECAAYNANILDQLKID